MRDMGDAFIACCSVLDVALFLTLLYNAVLSVLC